MTVVSKIIVAAVAACAVSTAASAQVRTFGPAVPFLVTGRSVSIPAIPQDDPQTAGDAGQRTDAPANADAAHAQPAAGDAPPPH